MPGAAAARECSRGHTRGREAGRHGAPPAHDATQLRRRHLRQLLHVCGLGGIRLHCYDPAAWEFGPQRGGGGLQSRRRTPADANCIAKGHKLPGKAEPQLAAASGDDDLGGGTLEARWGRRAVRDGNAVAGSSGGAEAAAAAAAPQLRTRSPLSLWSGEHQLNAAKGLSRLKPAAASRVAAAPPQKLRQCIAGQAQAAQEARCAKNSRLAACRDGS